MMSISQAELEHLFGLEKYQLKNISFDFPLSGEFIEIEVHNDSGKVKFIVDIDNSNLLVKKAKFQLRYQKIYSLRRIDFNGNHKNPPGPPPDKIFEGWENYTFRKEDHIHFYIDGFGERWALPLSIFETLGITPNDDLFDKMVKFFNYCNIKRWNVRRLLEL